MTKMQENIQLKLEARLNSTRVFWKPENLPPYIKLANNVTDPTQDIELHI